MTPRLFPVCTFFAMFLASEGRTFAQFVRSASNPYGQSNGGYLSIGISGAYGRGTTSKGFSPLSPIILNAGSHANPYAAGSNSNFFRPKQGDYMSGGAASYSQFGTVSSSVISSSPGVPDSSRKSFERWAQERDRENASGPDAPQTQAESRRRMLSPTPAEITSGSALNALVDALAAHTATLKTMQPMPIDDALAARLNFTSGASKMGLLNLHNGLEWPAVMSKLSSAEDLAVLRRKIDDGFRNNLKQIADNQPSGEALQRLHDSIETLRERTSDHARQLTFAENVELKRFLNGLDESVALLKRNDVSRWINVSSKRFPSLQALVLEMLDAKIRFAPALARGENAYASLHNDLAAIFSSTSAPGAKASR